MRDLLANTKPLWYALYLGEKEVTDEYGDFTGETEAEYSEPVPFRANISPARGASDEDAFGANLDYSHTISTANTTLPIDEYSLIWDKEPDTDEDGVVNYDTAQYKVVAVAVGLYHVKYAIQKLQLDEKESRKLDNEPGDGEDGDSGDGSEEGEGHGSEAGPEESEDHGQVGGSPESEGGSHEPQD